MNVRKMFTSRITSFLCLFVVLFPISSSAVNLADFSNGAKVLVVATIEPSIFAIRTGPTVKDAAKVKKLQFGEYQLSRHIEQLFAEINKDSRHQFVLWNDVHQCTDNTTIENINKNFCDTKRVDEMLEYARSASLDAVIVINSISIEVGDSIRDTPSGSTLGFIPVLIADKIHEDSRYQLDRLGLHFQRRDTSKRKHVIQATFLAPLTASLYNALDINDEKSRSFVGEQNLDLDNRNITQSNVTGNDINQVAGDLQNAIWYSLITISRRLGFDPGKAKFKERSNLKLVLTPISDNKPPSYSNSGEPFQAEEHANYPPWAFLTKGIHFAVVRENLGEPDSVKPSKGTLLWIYGSGVITFNPAGKVISWQEP